MGRFYFSGRTLFLPGRDLLIKRLINQILGLSVKPS